MGFDNGELVGKLKREARVEAHRVCIEDGNAKFPCGCAEGIQGVPLDRT